MNKYNITLKNGLDIKIVEEKFYNSSSAYYFEVKNGENLLFSTPISKCWEGHETYLNLLKEWESQSIEKINKIKIYNPTRVDEIWDLLNKEYSDGCDDSGVSYDEAKRFVLWMNNNSTNWPCLDFTKIYKEIDSACDQKNFKLMQDLSDQIPQLRKKYKDFILAYYNQYQNE